MISDLPIFMQIKIALVAYCGLNADAMHIYLGVGCLILTTFFTRETKARWALLLPGILVSVLIEVGDLYYDFKMTGVLRTIESLQDVINTNLLPFLLVALLRLAGWSGAKEPYSGQEFEPDTVPRVPSRLQLPATPEKK